MAKYKAMKADRSGWVYGDEILEENLFDCYFVYRKQSGTDYVKIIYSTIELTDEDHETASEEA